METQKGPSAGYGPFMFPYPPYSIQERLMEQVYSCIDEGGIGIFESPTGTGKSLSLLCGSLKWLKEHDIIVEEENEVENEPKRVPTGISWIDEHYEKEKKEAKERKENEMRERRVLQQKQLTELRSEMKASKKRKYVANQTISDPTKKPNEPDQQSNEYLIDNYESDDDLSSFDANTKEGNSELVDVETAIKRWNKIQEEELKDQQVAAKNPTKIRKIYYCSRTHTQLSQFLNELKKTTYKDNTQALILSSRSVYCINPKVSSLSSLSRINDTCQDMIKNKAKNSDKNGGKTQNSNAILFSDVYYNKTEEYHKKISNNKINTIFSMDSYPPSSSCVYLNNNSDLIKFRDLLLSKPTDIEEIVETGTKMSCCPYYATRSAIDSCELVLVPYNSIIHEPTRKKLGISLENNIVVIDEAHNLIDAINDMYTVSISLAMFQQTKIQLTKYLERYNDKLNGKNKVSLNKILLIINQFIKRLTEENDNKNESLMGINEFLFSIQKIDNINLFKVIKFIEKTNLINKLQGFVEQKNSIEIQVKGTNKDYEEGLEKHNSSLNQITSLLSSLTNNDNDGRVLVHINKENNRKSYIKFLLLNPEKSFAEAIKSCKSAILAGGTLNVSDMVARLVANRGELVDRLRVAGHGHVVDAAHLLCCVYPLGPSLSLPFDFRFSQRHSLPMMDEIGRLILNVVHKIPKGIIVFFASYQYEDDVIQRWKNVGIYDKIDSVKKIFREKKNSNGEAIFSEYCKEINGGIMSCVMNGKMSEGINFTDDYCRCVIIVGMPYANVYDLIVQEKSKYYKEKCDLLLKQINTLNNNNSSSNSMNNNLKEITERIKKMNLNLNENNCINSINQSIGRCIRNINDYSLILLLDHRFANRHIYEQLPSWVQRSMCICSNGPNNVNTENNSDHVDPNIERISFGKSILKIKEFFRYHENRKKK